MTSKELAKIAGVSPSTISRVMNDSPLISEKRKEEIRRLAKEYGFMLNSQAQSLKTKKTGTIAILMPRYFTDLCTNIFFTHLYDVISTELAKYEYDIMVIYSHQHPSSHLSPLERMVRIGKADGFLILRPHLSEDEIAILDNGKIPYTAIFMQNILQPLKSMFYINTEHGGHLAGTHFGSRPFDKILFLGLGGESVDNGPRLRGFLRGLKEAGYSGDIDILSGEMSMNGGYEAVMGYKAQMVSNSAIYAYNDMMAFGAINALTRLGYSVPCDVQLLGTDDIPLASSFRPQLSTVHAPVRQLARHACKTLIDSIQEDGTGSIIQEYKPHLVLRETTK